MAVRSPTLRRTQRLWLPSRCRRDDLPFAERPWSIVGHVEEVAKIAHERGTDRTDPDSCRGRPGRGRVPLRMDPQGRRMSKAKKFGDHTEQCAVLRSVDVITRENASISAASIVGTTVGTVRCTPTGQGSDQGILEPENRSELLTCALRVRRTHTISPAPRIFRCLTRP